jgi:hypothetical protein
MLRNGPQIFIGKKDGLSAKVSDTRSRRAFVQALALKLQPRKLSATFIAMVAIFHVVVPLIMHLELGWGTEYLPAV